MARPRTPFDQSPQSVIYHEIQRFAVAHGDQCPSPYFLWRQMRADGKKMPWSTYWYHWGKLVEAGRLVERHGIYWLPKKPQAARPPAPAVKPLQLALGF